MTTDKQEISTCCYGKTYFHQPTLTCKLCGFQKSCRKEYEKNLFRHTKEAEEYHEEMKKDKIKPKARKKISKSKKKRKK